MARTRLPSGGIGLPRLIWLGALTCAGAPAVWAQPVTSDYPIAGKNCVYMRNSSSPEDGYYACYGQGGIDVTRHANISPVRLAI